MKKLSLIIVAAFACVFLLSNLSGKSSKVKASDAESPLEANKRETFDRLIDSARRAGAVRVIVGLQTDFQPEGNLPQPELSNQRFFIKQAQNDFLNRFPPISSPAEVKRFEYIPYLAFETDAATLEKMRSDALVSSIQEDEVAEPGLSESVPLVGAPIAWASGYTGSGQTIAVLDSGIDKYHSFLSGKVISEACYSSNVPASGVTSFCPGGATESIAADSGLNCPTSVDGCAHGTHVAGIAAGRGTSFSGVAKDANLIAIKIFSQFTSSASCGNTSPCGRYYTSDLIRGLERVRTLADTMNNIVAVNLSLQTGQQFSANCDIEHSATKAAIDNLRSLNIATIICSGNFAFTSALTAPACISTAISVGSVGDGSLGATADAVVNDSDSSPLLHLLAPGRWINSSVPGGGFQNYTGTSMATPHVAGAFAILKQSRPNATISQMLNALIVSGQPITDSRNGIVKPRIKIGDAVNALLTRRGSFDFDGDGKADISVFRPSNGVWYLQQSTNGFTGFQFGLSSDIIVPADYDGDGKTDIAVFRNGTWYIQRSQSGFTGIAFGQAGDIPVPADYDGDGKADIAVFRPSSGVWYIYNLATNQFSAVQFGQMGDIPVVGDYDGDGKADIAVYRSGTWYIQRSQLGFTGIAFGDSNDKPVVGDYDGDGKADVAVFRPSSGTWYLQRSQLGFTGAQFGLGTDLPVPADYDGDGKTDIAVFRNGTWYLNESTAGFTGAAFGASTDKPVPNAFVP